MKKSFDQQLELAQYRKWQLLFNFELNLDASTQKKTNRGAKLTELLKQKQYSPPSESK